ncbi:MAG TPA: S1 RNA-binding domain-containing protein [Dehalococcoidia bacterium]|nr:S1 RNA-binding domain-containing protein [Dehalococcoidia bacterium]
METMGEYLDAQDQTYHSPRHGEVVSGTVVSKSKDGILVDIGSKYEGLIPESDLAGLDPEYIESIQVGNEVPVYVVRPESPDGSVLLSLRRGAVEKEWQTLGDLFKSGDIFEGKVIGRNKGGLIIGFEGVRGFVPLSQIASLPHASGNGTVDDRLEELVGKTIWLKIIEMNRRQNRLILSERLALHNWRRQQKERLVQEIQTGQVVRGRVSSLCDFGAFVDLGGADGLVPLSELSWGRVKHPKEVLQVGDEVETYVLNVDQESKRIALSLRRAQPSPWDSIYERYQVGQLVPATVTKLTKFGAFARLSDGLEGLVHISELEDRRIGHPKEVIKEGDELTLKIISIDPQRQRLGLSLKQAQEVLGRWQGMMESVGSQATSTVNAVPEAEPE